jgi:membrane-bound lytic murein transglycosylase A
MEAGSVVWRWAGAAIVGTLAACTSLPPPAPPTEPVAQPLPPLPQAPTGLSVEWAQALAEADAHPLPPALARTASTWAPARWADLPGLTQDSLDEAWNAWLRSCERPGPTWGALCREVRPLSLGSDAERWRWMFTHLQPHRVLAPDGGTPTGLLTGYYEPVMTASRVRTATHTVPLHSPPPGVDGRQPWHSRQAMDTLAQAQAALRGREIVWLADPVDALILQIQGSGRVVVTEPNGSARTVRLAFAAHNGHAYQSVGRWLLDQHAVRDASWPAIKTWAAQNPQRVNEMLWANPRTVFFREEPLSGLDAQFGPKGAQGVPLTPGRSIAVDAGSIPYGTPVWLSTPGPTVALNRLVLAQDTGGAITGAVRADYFVGWGAEAGTLAGGIKQPLQMWALWPRRATGITR